MQVLDSAQAVILASGTLAPLDSLRWQLFPQPTKPLHLFSCGHIVPPEAVLALRLGRGPSGKALNLRHGSRADPVLLAEMLEVLKGICQATPQVQLYHSVLVAAGQEAQVWWGSLLCDVCTYGWAGPWGYSMQRHKHGTCTAGGAAAGAEGHWLSHSSGTAIHGKIAGPA